MGKVMQMKPAKPEPLPVDKVKKLPKDYADLAAEYFDLTTIESNCKKRKDEIKEQLQIAQMTAKAERILLPHEVERDGQKVTIRLVATLAEGRSADKIDPVKLLKNGVTSDIIQASTDRGKPYHYVTVREYEPEKERRGGGHEE